MARYTSTFTAGASPKIIGALLDAASMAKGEKARAMQAADTNKLDKDNLGLHKGEFFGQALKYMMTPRFLRRGSFQSQFNYPSYFARGQSTPFASPINPQPTASNPSGSGGPRGGGGIDPEIVPHDTILGNMINVTPGGAPSNVQPQTSLLSSGSKRYESTTNKPAVKVKDEKLGVFFAAIAESLNRTVSSINQKQASLESDISSAKNSNLALAKSLEVSSDTIGDKLDAIADILNQQMALAKQQIDQSETKEVKQELKKEDDFSGTERFTPLGGDPEKTRQENELENNLDLDNEELDLNDFGGVDVPNFEQGGIVSGPDSGYLVRLHGDEMITPIDNNFTQGQPSAVDGVTRSPQYETGTSMPPVPQMPAMNFFAQRPSERSGNVMKSPVNPLKRDKFTEQKLIDAMSLPMQVAGLGMMAATGNAIRAIPGMHGLKTAIKGVTTPISDAFNEPPSISRNVNNLLEQKTVQTEQRNQEVYKKQQSENRRAWWDIFGLFRRKQKDDGGGGTGGVVSPYGVGGPGLSGAGSLQNLFHGTSNARASSIMSGGFRPSNALSWAGRGKSFLTPDFWNAAQYARPGATGLNPFSVKGLPGTGVSNLGAGRGQVLNVLTPKGSGMRLPGWLSRLGISPEVAVQPKQATKGMNLAQRLLGGKYPNSATANSVRRLMTSPAGGRSLSLMSKATPLLKAGGGLLGRASRIPLLTDMIFPDPTAQYDQMHGPHAYYNDPRYTGPRPDWAPPAGSNERSSFVDMSSRENSINRLSGNGNAPEFINMNNGTINNDMGIADEPVSHIDNMGETQVGDYQFVYNGVAN